MKEILILFGGFAICMGTVYALILCEKLWRKFRAGRSEMEGK